MNMRYRLVVLLLVALFSAASHGRVETHVFDTPEQEARYKEMIDQLRCLVCQNQNIADSNAELAQDLRQQTYDMLMAGKTDEQIYGYMVERYGDFVLYQPPVKGTTLLLWVGPFVILIGGIAILVSVIRKRGKDGGEKLSEADQVRATKLLEQEDEKS